MSSALRNGDSCQQQIKKKSKKESFNKPEDFPKSKTVCH